MALIQISLAFLLTVLLIPAGRRLAVVTGFVDRPGGRKSHDKAVPPIGGLIVFPVFFICLAPLVQDWSLTGWFYAASVLLMIVGALDDRFSAPPIVKFAGQFVAAALIVVPGHAEVFTFGNIVGTGAIGLSVFRLPFSLIAVVLLINAINLMDGLDGLAAGIGVIVLGGLAMVLNASPGRSELLVLIAALAGFLVFNMRNPWRRKAIVFLGDGGSLTLGLALAWFTIRFAGPPLPAVEPIVIAWLLALPIMDTCGQFARRVREGRHPFSADQDHFHHHFVHLGLNSGQATAAVLTVQTLYAAIGVFGIGLGVPQAVLLGLWSILLAGHVALSMRPARFRALLAHLIVRPVAQV